MAHGDKHHRRPRSHFKPGDKKVDDPRNISIVPTKSHRAWHALFKNETPTEIARRINLAWLDPDFYFVCVPRKKKKGVKHKHSLQVECGKCGSRCTMKHVKTRVLKKL